MNVVEIMKHSDLAMEVTGSSENPFIPTIAIFFRVRKDVLRKQSPVLLVPLGMLAGKHWKESTQSSLSLGEGFITVAQV